jgi:hypothetical protein
MKPERFPAPPTSIAGNVWLIRSVPPGSNIT